MRIMNILHTADWHLGQSFYEYDRGEEHRLFLGWLKKCIREYEADVLLVSGDVFDSPNPPASAQRLYYRFLREATSENPRLQIVITAGNHDSAARLEAPNPLFEEMNIAVRGRVPKNADGSIDVKSLIIPLGNPGSPEAYCLAVPYLRQGDYPDADTYAEGVRRLYASLYGEVRGYGCPVIAMGHLYACGSTLSGRDRSERVVAGGLDSVGAESFAEDTAYVALGHLHRPQRVFKRDNIRYAGSPVPMSFAEKHHKHGVVLVTLGKGGTDIRTLDFEPPVRIFSLTDSPVPVEKVFEVIGELPCGKPSLLSPILEIKVAIDRPEPSLRHRIEQALADKAVRLARIEAVIPGGAEEMPVLTSDELQALNPIDIATDVFRRRYGGEDMPREMRDLLIKVVKETGL